MSEAEFAAFLGIATSQVRTQTRDGIFVKDGRGRWNVRESLHNYLSQLRDGAHTAANFQPVRNRKSKGATASNQPQRPRTKKEKLHPGMSLAHYLANAEHWESEFQPFIDKALADPNFPPITKSFELTRYVKNTLVTDDLRREQRRNIMASTRFVWVCYRYALEDARREAENELLV